MMAVKGRDASGLMRVPRQIKSTVSFLFHDLRFPSRLDMKMQKYIRNIML
jgi:hypothetical protein